MRGSSFDEDRRYCPRCEHYVPYLISLEAAYCASCDQRVRLFSEQDLRSFQRSAMSMGTTRVEREPDERALDGLDIRRPRGFPPRRRTG